MRRLSLHKAVAKDLAQLPPKQFRQVVSAIFDLLTDPAPHYSRPLSGGTYHRIAVGEYRVIYRLEGEDLLIAAFGKRNDAEVIRDIELFLDSIEKKTERPDFCDQCFRAAFDFDAGAGIPEAVRGTDALFPRIPQSKVIRRAEDAGRLRHWNHLVL